MSVEIAIAHHFGDFALDVDFVVDRPGITALFGPSGSGKTTTINAVAGLLKPDRGRIAVNGDTLLDTGRRIHVPPRKRRFGYVFQDARLFPHLSVRANLLFGWKRAHTRAPQAEVDRIIELLGLGHLLTRAPRTLSGGERQRVALGRALLASPLLLLLDEPLAALDQPRKLEILPYLERLRDEAKTPMLYVSHSIDEVTRLADRMIVLNDGAIAAEGTVFDIMSRLDLFPLTGRFEAGAVIEARVAAHDDGHHLTELTFDGHSLYVPRIDAPPGTPVRMRIRARDVTLALDRPTRISANIVLPATIVEIRSDPGAHADVQLACGNAKLIARITRHSVARLELEPGTPVFALVKSITVDRRSLSAGGDV
ncbi:MAG: molybdenum ABC transporter ATP-binding protein [Methyloligellaceae bacterium]